MASITVRNIPEELHRAIRVLAAMHGHSTEAEVHRILEQAAMPEGRIKLGSMLASIACDTAGLTDAEAEAINQQRDKTPAEPMRFE